MTFNYYISIIIYNSVEIHNQWQSWTISQDWIRRSRIFKKL